MAGSIDKPTAHYRFDGNVVDAISGSAATTATAVSFVPGVFNEAVQFGAGSAITANPVISGARSFTVSVWINADRIRTSDAMVIVDERNRHGNAACGNVSCANYQLNIYSGKLAFEIGTRLTPQTDSFQTRLLGPVYSDLGVFHHVVGRFDAVISEASLWLDGIPVSKQTVGSVLNVQFESVLHVGRSTAATDQGWLGALDDLRIYDYALTESQIQQLSSVPEPGKVALLTTGLIAAAFVARRQRRR